jgi:hypothetical protein
MLSKSWMLVIVVHRQLQKNASREGIMPRPLVYAFTRIFCGIGGSAHVGGGAGGGPSTSCGMLRRLSSILVCTSMLRCRDFVPGRGGSGGTVGGALAPLPVLPPSVVNVTVMSDTFDTEYRPRRSVGRMDCMLARLLCLRDAVEGERLREIV